MNPLQFVRQEALAHRSHDEGQAVEEAVRHAARELGTSAGSAIADVCPTAVRSEGVRAPGGGPVHRGGVRPPRSPLPELAIA